MAAFALFYEAGDLDLIANQLVRLDLDAADIVKAALAWNGGFNNWESAPGAPYEHTEGSAYIKIVVVTAANFHLQDFVDLLRAIAAKFPNDVQAQYMTAIANDISSAPFGNNSAAVEPWNG